jgi:phosphate transport system protein
MVKEFHDALDALSQKVLEMGRLSEEMLNNAVFSLRDMDVELAQNVLAKKACISEMDAEIEEEALRILTLFNPMASDMRRIAAVLKMITYLARIGRYGKDIAKITVELAGQPHVKKLISIPYMASEVGSLIKDSLKAFEEETIEPLKDFTEREKNIDELRYSIFRECLTYMMEDSKTITRCTRYIMVARYLERCGDHAVKMGEKIHYMVTGEHIDLDPTGPETCPGT